MPEERVRLLAVSKTFGPQAVLAAIAQGQCDFGENYVQEAVEKRQAVNALLAQDKLTSPTAVHWHFIGPLQSNKTREIAETMDWIHSVDRLKIAQRLIDQRPPQLAPLQACLQVNISEEASKSGVMRCFATSETATGGQNRAAIGKAVRAVAIAAADAISVAVENGEIIAAIR